MVVAETPTTMLPTAAICINILSEVNTLQQQSLVLCRNPLLVCQRIQIILFNGFNSSMAAMQVQRIIELLMFDFSNVIHVQCAPSDGGASQLLVLTPWCIATSWAARYKYRQPCAAADFTLVATDQPRAWGSADACFPSCVQRAVHASVFFSDTWWGLHHKCLSRGISNHMDMTITVH